MRVLALAGGPRGHFSQALARRVIGLMDLLHRDLVAAPAPTGQNARRRYEAQFTVSVLMLARSARAVRALVLRSGHLEEQKVDDSDDDDGVPWHTVGEDLLIPPVSLWIERALAAPAPATHHKTQQPARDAPSHDSRKAAPQLTPRPAPTDDDHGSDKPTKPNNRKFYLARGPARVGIVFPTGVPRDPRVQGSSYTFLLPPPPQARPLAARRTQRPHRRPPWTVAQRSACVPATATRRT